MYSAAACRLQGPNVLEAPSISDQFATVLVMGQPISRRLVATARSFANLILDHFRRDRRCIRIGLSKSIQHLDSKFVERARQLTRHDPAVSLRLNEAETVLWPGTPGVPRRGSSDPGVAMDQVRVPRKRAAQRADRWSGGVRPAGRARCGLPDARLP